MKRRFMVVVIGCALGLVAAASVLAGGGRDIANAPELPIGQQVLGGGATPTPCVEWTCYYREFWKISLRASDRLTLDYSSTNNRSANVCLLSPEVTDYTVQSARCAAGAGTQLKDELRWTSPSAGRWTLVVTSGIFGQLAYELTAYVQHYTHASLTGPRVARARSLVTLRGQVSGLSAGKVAVQSRSKTGWKTLTLMAVKPNGSFVFKTRVGGTGTYRVRVVFYGDSSHLPTSAVYSLRVI